MSAVVGEPRSEVGPVVYDYHVELYHALKVARILPGFLAPSPG